MCRLWGHNPFTEHKNKQIASASAICGILKHTNVKDRAVASVGVPALKIAIEILASSCPEPMKREEIKEISYRIGTETGWDAAEWLRTVESRFDISFNPITQSSSNSPLSQHPKARSMDSQSPKLPNARPMRSPDPDTKKTPKYKGWWFCGHCDAGKYSPFVSACLRCKREKDSSAHIVGVYKIYR